MGKGVLQAVKNVNQIISPELLGASRQPRPHYEVGNYGCASKCKQTRHHNTHGHTRFWDHSKVSREDL